MQKFEEEKKGPG